MSIVEKIELFSSTEDANRTRTYTSIVSTGARIATSDEQNQVEIDVNQSEETVRLLLNWTPKIAANMNAATHLDFRNNRYQIVSRTRNSNREILFEASRRI